MVTDMATNDVFQDFTGDTSEGHWAVIFCKVAVTLFKDQGDQGLSPVMWSVQSCRMKTNDDEKNYEDEIIVRIEKDIQQTPNNR